MYCSKSLSKPVKAGMALLISRILIQALSDNQPLAPVGLGLGMSTEVTPVEYSNDFRFYVTTKLSRPHYSPEVCVKVTMLNFMVTLDGLEDQMLSIVVKHEEPAKYEKRNQCIVQKAENEKTVMEL